MKKIHLLAFFVLSFYVLSAQNPPKREMRAGWLATVARIDWPTTLMYYVSAENIAKQKAEFTAILDSVVAANMNAVFFQIRPECDALYNSAYEPWSEYLASTRGTNPGYDPLAFAIEESHKRGIELHAWLNPYRYERSAGKYTGKPGDYKTAHPEWILDYATYTNGVKTKDDITILDPGNPSVRKLIKSIVGDILSKYNVDGIIFDDYFYAYTGTSSTLDSYSQNLYKPASMTLSNWRRDNVNKMVADVYDTIQAVKPYVVFGVSPFGIWTTSSTVAAAEGITLPSGITGSNMYEQIYCDPVAWMKQGKVDYISPQLYWTTTSTGQDYKKLCPWWSDVAKKYNKYFYSSMSLTALTSTYNVPKNTEIESGMDSLPIILDESKPKTAKEIENLGFSQTESRIISAINYDDAEVGLEIDWNRNSTKNAAPGAVFFSIKNLWTKGKFTKYLREQKFQFNALPPAINWKSTASIIAPANVIRSANILSWQHSDTNIRYAVYAIPNALVHDATAFNNSAHLLGISYSKSFDLSKYVSKYSTHQFAVSALDRYGNEFSPTFVTTNIINPNVENVIIINTLNGIIVKTNGNSVIRIHNIQGQILYSTNISSEGAFKLPKGIFIVNVNSSIVKVIR
jgi:uncharacterized lipoprotein YddW (UPF0748 family)